MRIKAESLLLLLLLLASAVFLLSPQKVRSAFNNVVINEVQISGAAAEDEFVELYNPTGSSIDITGWRLTRNTQSGASESNLVASLSGTVPAGGYFLVANDDFSGSTTPDQLYSVVGNNLASNNSVTLYSDAGVTIIDRVGLGSSSLFEGAAVPTNPPAGGSVQRTQDTEDNAADFTVLDVSTPTNSSFIPTASPSATPTATPTETPTSTPTESPTPTATATSTPTPTASPTPEPTEEPSDVPLVTFYTFKSKVECRLVVRSFGFFRMLLPVCLLTS